LGELFAEWGIPTAISTLEAAQFKNELTVISSGGIRNGIDAAKALTIGGDLVGIALPVIQALSPKTNYSLLDWLNQFIKELKTTMFLVGALNISELQKKKYVIAGATAQWLKQRGIRAKNFTGE
jgi:isopentenyl-diphosphate delta-isomerase